MKNTPIKNSLPWKHEILGLMTVIPNRSQTLQGKSPYLDLIALVSASKFSLPKLKNGQNRTRELTTNTAAFLAFDMHKVWPFFTVAVFSPDLATRLGIYTFFHSLFFSLSFCQKRKKKWKVTQAMLFKMKREQYL